MFRSSLSVSLSPNEEELEALHLKTHYSRNKALQKIKNKAHLLHERGVVHVPPPFAAPIDEDDDGDDSTAAADSGLGDSEVKDGERPAKLYVYSGQQSFDRRAFLASLEDAYRLRAGGYKEREPVVLPDEDSIDTLSIVALFAKVDTSGDGSVTREELVRNCHVLHLSVEDAHRLFDKLDVNGDGEVSSEEFAEAVVEIEANSLRNLLNSVAEGDFNRLEDGLMRHTSTGSHVDKQRLRKTVTVDARGVGTFGPCPLLNFPNQNGELGRRLGSDEDSDRRVPRCSHVATDELEIASLGLPGHGVAGGLFLMAGDTLLHAVLRNAHLSNRMQMAEVLLAAGSDPNAVSSDGKKPYELDLQGRRHVWRRELEDHRAREAGREQNMAAFTGAVGI